MKKRLSMVGRIATILLTGGVFLVGSSSYLGWDLYKNISFKMKRPEIMQQIYQTRPGSKIVSVGMAVKQDPYWKKPERITYYGDKEIIYKKLEGGEWQMEEGVWTTGPDNINELRFEIKRIKKVTQKELPGNPKNALEILVDLDAGEEYAEADFEIKQNYEATMEEIREWVSNMKPLLTQKYETKASLGRQEK